MTTPTATYVLPGGRHRNKVLECLVWAKGATLRCMEVDRFMRVAEAVLDFMNEYLGVFVVLQKVGMRGPSPEPRLMRVRGAGRVRVTSDIRDCVKAALLNSLDGLWESEADKAAAVSFGAPVLAAEGQRGLLFWSMAPAGAVMNKMLRGLSGCPRATAQGRKIGR